MRRHGTLGFLCVFLTLLAAGCTANDSRAQPCGPADDSRIPKFSTPVTMQEIQSAFHRYSAPSVSSALMEHDAANWRMVMSKVAEGDDDWIFHCVAFLVPGADSGMGLDVIEALALALPKNPEAVLSLETWLFPIANVCSLPFPDPEYAFIHDYGVRTLAALRGVENPGLADARDTCARRLQASLGYLEKLHREGSWEE